jgi:hypothetical protein
MNYPKMLGMALVLFPAFLFPVSPIHADQGQLDCANMRRAILQLVGDWAREMLFASQEMGRDGWLDGNVARSAFKDVQIAVMHFDYAYEDVPKTRAACRDLAFRFGMEVGTYIEEFMATGTRPETAMQGLIAQ